MIAHLRGRDRKLELHGWTGQDAEWIALVCLHSGVFTRAQFCHYFDTANRVRAQRFVKMLLARKQAVETAWPTFWSGRRTPPCGRRLFFTEFPSLRCSLLSVRFVIWSLLETKLSSRSGHSLADPESPIESFHQLPKRRFGGPLSSPRPKGVITVVDQKK